jgi:hypothetical protein
VVLISAFFFMCLCMFFSILAVVRGGRVNGIGDLDQNRSARYWVLGLLGIILHMLGTQYMSGVLDNNTSRGSFEIFNVIRFGFFFSFFPRNRNIYLFQSRSTLSGDKVRARLKTARIYLA